MQIIFILLLISVVLLAHCANHLFQIGKFLETPKVKFWSSACSFIAFVIMVIAFTATEEPSGGSLHEQLVKFNPRMQNRTFVYKNLNGNTDVRVYELNFGTYLLTVWILGKTCQYCFVRVHYNQ